MTIRGKTANASPIRIPSLYVAFGSSLDQIRGCVYIVSLTLVTIFVPVLTTASLLATGGAEDTTAGVVSDAYTDFAHFSQPGPRKGITYPPNSPAKPVEIARDQTFLSG